MSERAASIAGCSRDEQDRLVVIDDCGNRHVDVRPFRMFPITDPDGLISICDSQGRELFCIASIDLLPPECRGIILDEIKRCMFTPIIREITSSIPFGEYARLFIETDRGATDITVDTEDIYRLSDNRILLKDTHGIRYLIPDWRKMNGQSRKILDTYI